MFESVWLLIISADVQFYVNDSFCITFNPKLSRINLIRKSTDVLPFFFSIY